MGKMRIMEDVIDRIEVALRGARRPAVMWSGGKDSTVLLHLAKMERPDIECIQWRLPWIREKWAYHERMAARWDLTLHDQLPAWSGLCHGNGRIDIMEGYAIGEHTMVIARGTDDLDEMKPWVCGMDWLCRPKAAQTQFPWDVLLCGHKQLDEDPCSGPVPLQLDVLRPAGCAEVHYPIRNLSDADVTQYMIDNGIEWDGGRYDLGEVGSGQLAGGSEEGSGSDDCGLATVNSPVLRTRADKSLNSDYYNTCMRCIDKREGAFVRCPKSQLVVDNISGRCQEYVPRHDYCALRTEEEDGK